MQRAHQIRLYPTREQEIQLKKTAGASRYAYNWALAKWKSMYEAVEKRESTEKPTAFGLVNKWTQERPDWSHEVSRDAQNKAIINVGDAFKNLWKGKSQYPQFHKKGHKDSFYVPNNKAQVLNGRISLPKIGKVRLAEEIRYEGKIMSYTVSGYAGQWHVSVQVETPDKEIPCLDKASVVGIDVGLKHIAVASDGSVLDAPESLTALQQKLKWEQRKLSHKQKKSNNYHKQLKRKQKIQLRINNIRKDVSHKFTTSIAKSHGTVAIENLNIKGMMEHAGKHLRSSLAQSIMSEVLRQLEYKAHRVVKVDRFFPSSKRCSRCGHVKEQLDLSERTYKCESCGLVLDRDYNAACNLMYAGTVGPGVPVEQTASRL